MALQLRDTVRALLRARTFSAAVVATVGLAVGAGCAVFGLVDHVLLRPLPYPNADRLVGLWHSFPGVGISLGGQSPGTYFAYRRSAKVFEDIGSYDASAVSVVYPDPRLSPERVRAGVVTASIFSMLGVRPLLGRTLDEADNARGAPPVVVISEGMWHDRFGGHADVLGKEIEVGGLNREIVGVLPATFAFPEPATQLWIPFGPDPQSAYLGSFVNNAIGRLRPGVTRAEAQRDLQRVLERIPQTYPEQRPGISTADLLRQARITAVVHWMRDDVIGGFDKVLWLVAATVALLVLVAFSNVASLVLVRIEARRRDLAIRTALGAPASDLWLRFVIETGGLTLIGGAAGFGLGAVGLRAMVRYAPAGVPRLNEVRVDGTLIAAAILLTGLFAVWCAILAAARLGTTDRIGALRESGRSSTGGGDRQRLRTAFVAVQVALAVVLVSGAAVMMRSLRQLAAVRPGFNAANVMTFWTATPAIAYPTPARAAAFFREAVRRIGELPGVVSVGAASKLPLEIDGTGARLVWVDGVPVPNDGFPPAYNTVAATDAYFQTMQIPLLAGRSFKPADGTDGRNTVVVSQGFALHYWHDASGREALGRRIRVLPQGPWFTIVGVVGGVRDTSLTAGPTTNIYFPETSATDSVDTWMGSGAMGFVVRTRADSPVSAKTLQGVIRQIDPSLPIYNPRPLAGTVADAGGRMSFALLVLAVGAIATLALSLVGIYGVIAYVVSLRRREIAVRIALGLMPSRATRMILRRAQHIAAAGALAGLVLFLGFSRLLGNLVFGVRPVDPGSLVGAVGIILAVAGIAAWTPARQAAAISPTEALTSE
ncbi:MAG TPA: ADOP family duplicated permease [Gemmatimonadaceae bacterium]|nr:ADOP family duplicated permease [Gemmatimonadaceae bacterium]